MGEGADKGQNIFDQADEVLCMAFNTIAETIATR